MAKTCQNNRKKMPAPIYHQSVDTLVGAVSVLFFWPFKALTVWINEGLANGGSWLELAMSCMTRKTLYTHRWNEKWNWTVRVCHFQVILPQKYTSQEPFAAPASKRHSFEGPQGLESWTQRYCPTSPELTLETVLWQTAVQIRCL